MFLRALHKVSSMALGIDEMCLQAIFSFCAPQTCQTRQTANQFITLDHCLDQEASMFNQFAFSMSCTFAVMHQLNRMMHDWFVQLAFWQLSSFGYFPSFSMASIVCKTPDGNVCAVVLDALPCYYYKVIIRQKKIRVPRNPCCFYYAVWHRSQQV